MYKYGDQLRISFLINFNMYKYYYYLKFPYNTIIYIITKENFIKTKLCKIDIQRELSYAFDSFEQKIRFILSSDYPQPSHGVRGDIYIYSDSGEICSTCLSLMRDFDVCAPVIQTKIGELIL